MERSTRLTTIYTARSAALSLFCMTLLGCSTLASADPVASPRHQAAIGQAEQLSEAFSLVAEQASPAVVSIRVEAQRSVSHFFFGRQPSPAMKGGSGFIFRSDGAVLTNNHVVENAERIDVVLQDGRSFQAELVGTDPATDLAVLKVHATNLPYMTFANSDKARVGQWVVAIGSPFGLDYTLTVGVVSAVGRGLGANEIEDYLQTDASINPGNSGGPLMNLAGKVLGINTIIVGPTSAGVGFAIPSNLAKRVAEQLLTKGSVQRAWIGVSFQELTPDLAKSFGTKAKGGALVASVVEDGPAQKAGIRAGDIIEKVDDVRVEEGRDLLREVLEKDVGQTVTLTILRGKRRRTLTLTTGERPGSGKSARLEQDESDLQSGFGLSVQSLNPQLARRLDYRGKGQVVVTDVDNSGVAARAGIKPGDVILRADNKKVQTPEDVADALKDGAAVLLIEREGSTRFFALSRGR